MKRTHVWAAVFATALLVSTPTIAQANTPVNSFTPQGTSWVDAPNKTYLETFGDMGGDSSLLYVPTGTTCTYHGTTAHGPFLKRSYDDGTFTCSAGTPPDGSSRTSAVPFGFSVNFFGQNYSSAWPSIDGGIFFANPDNWAGKTMPNLISSSNSSAMFPFGTDLEFDPSISNLWTAQTVIDSHAAIIFAWEHLLDANNSSSNVSFQLVLIDLGSGDFNAYFNFDQITGIAANSGYPGPALLINLANGVEVGSNIAQSLDAKYLNSGCLSASNNSLWLGNLTSGVQDPFDTNNDPIAYLKKESNSTVSLWTDSACSLPLTVTTLQDVSQDSAAYVELMPDLGQAVRSAAIGWGTFNSTTRVIDWTEIQRNVDLSTLVNGQPNALVSQSLNTTVPGRYVIGQRSGQTVVESSAVTPNGNNGGNSNSTNSTQTGSSSSTSASLAQTGTDFKSPLGLAIGAFLFGIGASLMKRFFKTR